MIEGKQTAGRGPLLTFGMIGGGTGSFIGDVHRKAAVFDGKSQMAAGCFSRSWETTLETGRQLGLPEDRLYKDFTEMAVKEAEREDGIDFVVIATPNYAHYKAAKVFLENGIHVVCDKPVTQRVEEAEELAQLAAEKDLLFAVTYSYSQCPMVRHAREMVRRGDIGDIRVVVAEYSQGWLAEELEKTGQRQAAWRTDPDMAGISNCTGDIGSHIEHTVSYITGLEIDSLCARLDAFGEDRPLDTNSHVMLKFTNGAVGNYWASQVAVGRDNSLIVRIYGTKGGIEWEQEAQNYLKVAMVDGPVQILSRGNGYVYPEGAEWSRLPSGHPEGLYESFANTYNTFLTALAKKLAGEPLTDKDLDFPNIHDGVRGVRYVHKCVESSQKDSSWLKF